MSKEREQLLRLSTLQAVAAVAQVLGAWEKPRPAFYGRPCSGTITKQLLASLFHENHDTPADVLVERSRLG